MTYPGAATVHLVPLVILLWLLFPRATRRVLLAAGLGGLALAAWSWAASGGGQADCLVDTTVQSCQAWSFR